MPVRSKPQPRLATRAETAHVDEDAEDHYAELELALESPASDRMGNRKREQRQVS